MTNKFTKILLFLSIAVFLFGAGIRVGELRSNSKLKTLSANSKNIDFALFWQAWSKLEEKFVDQTKLDKQQMFYGAIKGMTASLGDPYTFFLTPEENQQSKDDLGDSFQGIGAQLGLKNNQIVVIAPLKNSPAESAGILAGDIILKVDDQSTEAWTLPYAVSKIRGKAGTKVKLTLERLEKEIVITVIRDDIEVDSVELTFEKEIAILKLIKFGDDTVDEWNKTVETIRKKWLKKEIKGMILDLRDNPGGYLEGSVSIASEFLPLGKIVVTQEYTNGASKKYKVNHEGKLLDIPLIVLINKGSASASEIVAGALRDHKRAKLVGEKSFGKGSIQEALDLKNGAGLHVTIAKWILPGGSWINSVGVSPELKVENKIDQGNTLERKNDLQLEKAIEEVLK